MSNSIVETLQAASAGEWQPIETAPRKEDWLKQPARARVLIGCWHQPVDEGGEPDGDGYWAWAQVASLTPDGWHVCSNGFSGWHGTASIPVSSRASHWMPLPDLFDRAITEASTQEGA